MLVKALFPSGDDFRKNREAIARWSLRKNRSVSSLLNLILEESPFWHRHRRRSYVAKLLQGAKAAELPIEQAERYHLVINPKTAAALGLTIPTALLATADEVIE
jgi:hypothetical protein